MPNGQVFTFCAGLEGAWKIESIIAVAGESLAPAQRLRFGDAKEPVRPGDAWRLSGFSSNMRYTTAVEAAELAARSPGLGRAEARSAALIPIRKSEAWWRLAQDERRAIFEQSSQHIATGIKYLPQIARRLHHSRDLGEPFDFLTWFEFAPRDGGRFDDLVEKLRATEEWRYVEREIDIRLTRAGVVQA